MKKSWKTAGISLCAGKKKKWKQRVLSIFSAILLATPMVANADSYPSAPIKFVVPFGPGSATDTLARIIGEKASAELGVPVIVENRAGALGTIGTSLVAKAPADGYTLLVGTSTTNAAIQAFVKSVPYDPQKDFSPISFIGELTQIVVVGSDSRFNSLPELLAYAAENPGKLTYAWSNTVGRMSTAMLAQQANVQFTDIPYKEAGTALIDVVSGRVDFAIDNAISTSSQIQGKNLRPLAVSSSAPLATLPDVPTVAQEANLPDYEVKAFFALFAPAGTPEDIIRKLSHTMRIASEDPHVQRRLAALGMEVRSSTPEQLKSRIDTEIIKWTQSARLAGIEPQ